MTFDYPTKTPVGPTMVSRTRKVNDARIAISAQCTLPNRGTQATYSSITTLRDGRVACVGPRQVDVYAVRATPRLIGSVEWRATAHPPAAVSDARALPDGNHIVFTHGTEVIIVNVCTEAASRAQPVPLKFAPYFDPAQTTPGITPLRDSSAAPAHTSTDVACLGAPWRAVCELPNGRFAGHGMRPDGRACLLTANASGRELLQSMVPAELEGEELGAVTPIEGTLLAIAHRTQFRIFIVDCSTAQFKRELVEEELDGRVVGITSMCATRAPGRKLLLTTRTGSVYSFGIGPALGKVSVLVPADEAAPARSSRRSSHVGLSPNLKPSDSPSSGSDADTEQEPRLRSRVDECEPHAAATADGLGTHIFA